MHIDTARRWKRTGIVPGANGQLIYLKLNGDLGILSPSWRGWRINNNNLWTPEGDNYSSGDIHAIRLLHQLISELQRQLRKEKQCNS